MARQATPLRRLRTRELDQALSRFVRALMRDTGTPGVAVGVLHKGRAFASGFGVTSIEAPDPVDTETLFQIGSTTKTFTATAIMKLVERGEIELDAPVRRYLRDLRLKDPDVARKVTVRHLLTHTGGWAGDLFYEGSERGDDSLALSMERLKTAPQLTPLGSVWHYNNAGFYIAGRIIEKVTKKSYEQAIREILFEPLGMTRSFFFTTEAIGYRIAAGHVTKSFRAKKHMVARPWELPRYVGPAGGIISDVVDQLRWAQFHMGDGRGPDGKRLLKVSTMREMQRPQVAAGGSIADHVGLSWMLDDVKGVRLVAHGGTTHIGHLSAFVMVPERDFAVTVLTNSMRGIQVHKAVVDRALELYLGIKRRRPAEPKADGVDVRAYEGHYVDGFKSFAIDVEARGKGLRGTYSSLNSDEDPGLPPFRLSLLEDDRAVISGGRLNGYRADFLRDERGRVRWFRIGGRLLRRTRAR